MGLLRLPWGYLCQQANHWISLLRGYWGYLGATFANKHIIGFHCYGETGATLELPLPTSKSLDFNAMGLLGLPWSYLCRRGNRWISLLCGYWGYLGATFANEQIVGFHCYGETGATFANQTPLFKKSIFRPNSIQNKWEPYQAGLV